MDYFIDFSIKKINDDETYSSNASISNLRFEQLQ